VAFNILDMIIQQMIWLNNIDSKNYFML